MGLNFMQIISKNIDYSKNKVNLNLFETSIKDIIRKIKNESGKTLENIANGGYVSNSLLTDIKNKQNQYVTNFDDYIQEIIDFAAVDNIDLFQFTNFEYNYSELGSEINAEKFVNDTLLNKIMNNEGYYFERRTNIRSMLNHIKDTTLQTHILGQKAHYPDQEALLSAVSYNDLTLDYLINYSEEGEEIMMLRKDETDTQIVNSNLTVGASDYRTENITFNNDEILFSLDGVRGISGIVNTVGINIDVKYEIFFGETLLYTEQKLAVTGSWLFDIKRPISIFKNVSGTTSGAMRAGLDTQIQLKTTVTNNGGITASVTWELGIIESTIEKIIKYTL